MNLSIPFFSLKRQWKTLQPSLDPLVLSVLESGQFVGGTYVEQFEASLATYLKSPHVITCNSGTDALWLALRALDLKEGSIVLTTPFSFIASSSEIVAHKAHPVFIDIDEKTYNISPARLEEWLKTHATLKEGVAYHKTTHMPIVGIVAVNLFGQCADYKALSSIADLWNLWIVEDAAQSIGSSIDGQLSGTFGTISTFSFYPTKNLGACGDGGALSTSDAKLAHRIRSLRNHGRPSRYDYTEYGINSRLDGIQAAILNEKLKYITEWNTQRNAHAALYKKLLAHNLAIVLPESTTGYHSYHQFCIQIQGEPSASLQTRLCEFLAERSIGSNIFYPKPLSALEILKTDARLLSACPVADALAQSIVALPIWPELYPEEIETIAQAINDFCLPLVRLKKDRREEKTLLS